MNWMPRRARYPTRHISALVICSHAGNVATEDLVYLLNGFGIAHGIDMERLLDASAFISTALGREPHSRVARALLARRRQERLAAAAAA